MKQPISTYAGHATFDLTEGKVHKLTDGGGKVRFVVLFPKTWEPLGEKMEMQSMKGPVVMQQYLVTEWVEHTLQLV